jgi:hypothetical protein
MKNEVAKNIHLTGSLYFYLDPNYTQDTSIIPADAEEEEIDTLKNKLDDL